MSNNLEQELKRNLKRFRRWLANNQIARVVQGFLPSFLDFKTNGLTVIVDDDMQPRTDGHTIWVSLLPSFLRDRFSEKDWAVVMRAAAAHEAQHVNSSSFQDVKEISEWFGKYLEQHFGLEEMFGQSVAKQALNSVEDGRIEGIAVKRKPGMLLPFQWLNKVIREGTTITEKATDPRDEYHDFWGNVLSYAKTGLYSPGIGCYSHTTMESNFLAIRSLIDDGVSGKTSGDCRKAVEELLDEVSPYIAGLIKASPELQEDLRQPAPDEYTSDSETQFGDGAGSGVGNPLRSSSPGKGQGDGQGQQPGNGIEPGSIPSQESPMGFSNAQDAFPPIDQARLDEVRAMMEQSITNANQAANAEQQTDGDQDGGLDQKAIEDIKAVYGGQNYPINQTKLKVTSQLELPAAFKAQAMRLRRDILRVQAARTKARKNLRRGVLDPKTLWKFGVSDDSMFYKKGDPNAGSIAFYLLIDNSGSMIESGDDESGKSIAKFEAARTAAAVIEEATKGIVPCKVALFNQSGCEVNQMVIRGFDDQDPVNLCWNSLKEVGPGGCNADSVNIRIASEDLTRRPEKRKVLIILSDGEPSAYASQMSAQDEVRAAVTAARRKGNIVIPIMFGELSFLKSHRGNYEKMYEKNIISARPQAITSALSTLFQQVISR